LTVGVKAKFWIMKISSTKNQITNKSQAFKFKLPNTRTTRIDFQLILTRCAMWFRGIAPKPRQMFWSLEIEI